MKRYSVYPHPEKDGWLLLRFSYSVHVIKNLKAIDKEFRDFNPYEKQWGIEAAKFEEIKSTIFPEITWELVNRFDADDYDALWVKAGAPDEVIEAAYLALIQKHRDDDAQLNEINLAYRRIKTPPFTRKVNQ